MLGRPAVFVRVRLSCLFGCRLAESNNKSDVKKLVLRVSRRFLQNAEAGGSGTGLCGFSRQGVSPEFLRHRRSSRRFSPEHSAFRQRDGVSFVFPTGAWGLPAQGSRDGFPRRYAAFWRHAAPDCASGRFAGEAVSVGRQAQPEGTFSPDMRCRAAAPIG